MKLRIKNNSIRYRLDKNDIQELGAKGYVEGRTEIGPDLFVYSLQGSDELQLNCKLGTNKITIYMPTAQIKEWVTSERVGYEHHMDLQSGNKLHLLLEKDFKCLDDTVEDQSNNYDNPLTQKKDQ
ncbi:MAG: hypothetical protein K0R82_1088 [Flavipsychrobacter sp.]|nr:hypothetical protein [Flavipsychrobacter sp.]